MPFHVDLEELAKREIPDFTPDELSIILGAGYRDPYDWLTYRQAAVYLGTSEGAIRVYVHRGKLPDSVDTGSKLALLPRQETLERVMSKEMAAELVRREKRTLGQIEAPEVAHLAGKKQKRTQATYLRILSDRVTPKDWLHIIDKAVADAKRGDYRARNWLSNYLIGTPIKRIAAAVADTTKRFSEDERKQLVMAMLLDEESDEEDGNGYHDEDDDGVIEASYSYSEEAD